MTGLGRCLRGAVLPALLVAAPLPALAQDSGAGGMRLTFGVEQRLETDDNFALATHSAGRTTYADTILSLGFASETRTERLVFNASGRLRASDGPGLGAEGSGFVRPSLSLQWGREAAGASFDLRARLQETEIEALRGLADFTDADGVITLPDDLSELQGTGTRRSISTDVALKWGQDGPLGFGLRAGFEDLSYHDTSSTSLIDYRRIRVGASTQMQLDRLLRASFDLGLSRYERDDPSYPHRDTITFSGNLTRETPLGNVSAGLSVDHTEEGNRLGISFGRRLDLPAGGLNLRLGATRTAVGHHLRAMGAIDLSQELPMGVLHASLERSVSASNEDREQLVTALSLSLMRELTPTSRLGVDLSYVTTDRDSGGKVDRGSLGVSWRMDVTRDWGLDIGYRHRLRRETGFDSARSNSVYLALRRSFEFRP